MFLEGVKGSKWKLVKPISLDVTPTGLGQFMAKDSEQKLNVYGVGDTPETAVEEFGEMLIDLYEELIYSPDLSTSMAVLLKQLEQIIQPVTE